MLSNFYLLWTLAIPWLPTPCLCTCESHQTALTNDECSELYFESHDKAAPLGQVRLQLVNDSLTVTPTAPRWTTSFLKISLSSNETDERCSKLVKQEPPPSFCLNLTPDLENETLTLQYRVEDLPEISYRKFIFTVPQEGAPLFLYVDITDMSILSLGAQKLPASVDVASYKVEAYKERNGNTNLQDVRTFSSEEDIYYEVFTYNAMGGYYFVVSAISGNTTDRILTPKVSIGRKSTRVVIGIVGASFILPFVLFLFHVLTKKYPEDSTNLEEKLIVAYKSSTKKHNEVVLALAAFLEKSKTNHVEIIDLSKSTRKLCSDSLFIGSKILYVAPPKHDLNPILVNKSLSEKNFYGVAFAHCDDLPQFISSSKSFRLFDDLDKLLEVLGLSEGYDEGLRDDLARRVEEAVEENEKLGQSDLPKIVVTDLEPQEHDKLISAKVVL